jgi:hypothetical protein
MHQEVIAIKVPIDNADLIELFVAPSYVVRALAEFLAEREDEDGVSIKGSLVNFQDFSVTVGDSKKVVSAYECLCHYNLPLGNYDICQDIIHDAHNYSWNVDHNFKTFEKWFKTRKTEIDDQDE